MTMTHALRATLLLLAFVLAGGCAESTPTPETVPAQPPSLAQLENLTFEGVYDAPVALTSGVYEGEPFEPGGELRPRLELVENTFLTADLDGDDRPEAAVLLSESSGGSGVFTYLAIASGSGDQVQNIATTEIGDRVIVRSMEARGGALVMDLVETGLDDPVCCPTLKVRNTYQLDGGRLTVKSEEMGRLSVDDLSGTTWRLSHWGWHDPVEEGVEITASFADGKVSGKSACNQYNAGFESSEGAELTIGMAAVTKMACPDPVDQAERRYLAALGGVTQFSFAPGKLILIYQAGDDFKSLVFKTP